MPCFLGYNQRPCRGFRFVTYNIIWKVIWFNPTTLNNAQLLKQRKRKEISARNEHREGADEVSGGTAENQQRKGQKKTAKLVLQSWTPNPSTKGRENVRFIKRGKSVYTGSRLQRIWLQRAPGYNEHLAITNPLLEHFWLTSMLKKFGYHITKKFLWIKVHVTSGTQCILGSRGPIRLGNAVDERAKSAFVKRC